jgi:hypothetical protein
MQQLQQKESGRDTDNRRGKERDHAGVRQEEKLPPEAERRRHRQPQHKPKTHRANDHACFSPLNGPSP